MPVRAETVRVAGYAAAVTGEPVDIAAARLPADEAAERGARDCLRVGGGTGFTWESEVHPPPKRAGVRTRRGSGVTESEEMVAADRPPERADRPSGWGVAVRARGDVADRGTT
jgi:hypothetical protein